MHGLHLLFMKRRRHEPVRFLFVHLRHVARRDPLTAVRAENRAVIFRVVLDAINDAFIVHLHKVALAHLLVVGDERTTIGACDRQHMAATDFFAVWIGVDFHG